MAVRASLCLVFAVFMVFLCSSEGYKFYVGGKAGWVINPSEGYDHWARRNRFQVNDNLVFKFKKGEDSVLLVTKENYDTCNVNNPIKSITEESEYKFERSGPHYFISGKADHCSKGQKIVIVVLAIRPTKTPPPPPPTPTVPAPVPVASPPPTPSAQVPASPSVTPAPSPSSKDGPAPSEQKKNSGAVFGAPLASVVLSVVIGVGVFLGS